MIDTQITGTGRLAGQAPARASPGGWAVPVRQRLLPGPRRHRDGPDGPGTGRRASSRERRRRAIERGLGWFLGMQGVRWGLGAPSTPTTTGCIFNNIPFADHGALLDPVHRGPDRALRSSCLGTLGDGPRAIPRRARAIALHPPHPEPRRGVVRALGRQLHLRDVVGAARRWAPIGEDVAQEYVRRAVAWLELAPEPRRRLGRDPRLVRRPRPRRAAGESIPSQTAWALLALFAVGARRAGPAVERGIAVPHARRRARTATWEDPLWNGTGFPRVFYLKYHLYAKYFPLWALGVYRSARS